MTESIAESINVEALSFEQAFARLGEVLDQLEQGDLPLEEGLALYEEGMSLAKHCNLKLDSAELRIKTLTPGGELEPFDEG